MHITRIDHVSLDVHDRRGSLAFYEEVLGLRAAAAHDVPDQPVFLGPLGARLGLFAERAPGLRHVALATDAAGQHALAARLERPRDRLPARAPPRQRLDLLRRPGRHGAGGDVLRSPSA